MARESLFFFIFIFLGCFALSVSISDSALANSKYAALVIDADSGSVLYASNANALRYPASLAKMMTLYLAFEALEEKQFALDTRLKVSRKAASMPQTNIGLRKGETIKVRDIIRSLVVRSANDAAVVMAESLGKSESGFAKLMTTKARALGMKNTTFRNASGLPDRKQRTTARDMTVLALALKKHFPQYFHFFRIKTFRYKGKTYKGHNKVMSRYPGADGIKTGYIRASGFNLVTSARRNGRNIIATVMGGKTSRRRDNHMIDLLDRSFAKLEKRGSFVAARAFPIPKAKPQFRQHAKSLHRNAGEGTVQKNNRGLTLDRLLAKLVKYVPGSGGVKSTSQAKTQAKAKGQFAPPPLGNAKLTSTDAATGGAYRDWGIQVGAFDKKQSAYTAVNGAMSVAGKELSNSRVAVSDMSGNKVGHVIYRARMANLTERQARKACKALLANRSSCFVFQVQNASDL